MNMKVLVIQNGESIPKQLIALLPISTVVTYPLSSELNDVNPNDYDVVLLSGSSQFPVLYSKTTIEPEVKLILRCQVPLLGICYGCELLAHAYGSLLEDVGEEHKFKGIFEITTTEETIFIPPQTLSVYEAHRWHISKLADVLITEAISERGPEIIRHRTLPQVGFQFHPEKFVYDTDGDELFRAWWNKFVVP